MNCRNLAVILVVVSIVILPSAMAVGISPGLREVVYVPYEEVDVTFWASSAGSGDNAPVKITTSGYMQKYMETNITQLYVNEGENVPFTITLHFPGPDDVRPGKHTNKVVITETRTPTGSVGGIASVAGFLDVMVPAGDYYVEMEFAAPDTEVGEDVPFAITLTSYGRKSTVVSGKVDIYEIGVPEPFDTVSFDSVQIDPGHKKIVTIPWDPKDTTAGDYSAIAEIRYQGVKRSDIKKFRLGDVSAKIWKITGTTVSKGDVAKLTFYVESMWMHAIEAVNGEVRIDLSKNRMESITTNSINMKPGRDKDNKLVAYWNTRGYSTGTYDATLTLRYGDKTLEEEFQVEVVEGGIGKPILLGIALIPIIGAAAFYFIQHKKKVEEELKRLEEEEQRKLQEEQRRMQEEQRRLQEEARRKYEEWRRWWEYYYRRGGQ